MQRQSIRIALSLIGIIAACIGAYALWNYIYSFQEVTFRFNSAQGYVEIVGADKQKLYPIDAQPVRLKKGEYAMRNVGNNIKLEARTLTVDSTTYTINTTFNYTDSYLRSLYVHERTAIEALLRQSYPKAETDYTLARGRLYHQGEYYGAILIARDPLGDNADTLRILAEKKDGKWQLRSMPPAPILSVPFYRDVDRSILLDINQAK
ncbi:hypothetical protein I8H83_03580 [Candidatus Saccharibacteria bacterium]|nr:hypothetical protein [Candidatus Saccharibacteria bacterium]